MTTPEQELLQKIRASLRAKEHEGVDSVVNVFVGSEVNCQKIQAAHSMMQMLQVQHPGLPLETFVVVIPEDPEYARMMERNLIKEIQKVFKQAHPQESEMN